MTSCMETISPEEGQEISNEPVQPIEDETLNETVTESLLRDVRSIGRKLAVVLIPSKRNEFEKELKNWELWGPLIISLVFACSLVGMSPSDDPAILFSIICVVMWVGALAVTVNVSLLGGHISFFQSLCLMGYCIFPFAIVALVALIFSLFCPVWVIIAIKFFLGLVALGWAMYSTIPFFRGVVSSSRVLLALYPVALFYGSITWLLISGGMGRDKEE